MLRHTRQGNGLIKVSQLGLTEVDMCRVICSGVQRKSLMPLSRLGLATRDKCARTDAQACSVSNLRPMFQSGAGISACLLGAEEAGLLDAHIKGLLPCLIVLQTSAQVLQEIAV